MLKLLFLCGIDASFVEYDERFGIMTDFEIKNYLCELHSTSLIINDEPRVEKTYINIVKGDY